MEHIYIMPQYIEDKEEIYEFITTFYDKFSTTSNSKIVLDFSLTSYINPNLMSPLGLILTKIKSKNNEILLSKMRPSIQQILLKYGFVKISKRPFPNIMQNYITYKSFSGDDADGFENYLNSQLKNIENKDLITTLISYIMEIFVNVKTHARPNENKNRFKNKEIFTSGYYNQTKNYIRFSIANNGNPFKINIDAVHNKNFINEYEYIEWALKNKHTSKTLAPGGLGLFMLNELVNISNGTLIILSGKGYYNISYCSKTNNFEINKKDFNCAFPGTVVTIKLPLNLVPSGKIVNKEITFDTNDILKGVI